jgi:hypothetical protein
MTPFPPARPTLLTILILTGILLLIALISPARLFTPLLSEGFTTQADAPIQISAVDLIYFTAILLGVVGKALWDHLNRGLDGQPSERRVLLIRIALSSIIAVLIYATAVNSLAESQVVTLAGISVAFQGGFFWQTLFQNLSETMHTS